MKIENSKEIINLELPNKICNKIYNNINDKYCNIAYIENMKKDLERWKKSFTIIIFHRRDNKYNVI